MSVCALCREKKDLRRSHIIPSFVGKWLKDTSGTGFLRGTVEPDKRLQDLRKIPLLCKDCEQRLSALETYFANEFFYPFFDDEKRVFKYDSRLARFVVSLSWRSLLASYDDSSRFSPNLMTYVDRAEETWRKYLLGTSNNLEPYEHHLFFLDYVEKGSNIPHGFQWYTLRAVDATLVGNDKKVFAYAKFPWMLFVSSIEPTKLEGFENTRIEQSGTVQQPQIIKDESFGSFLVDRVKVVLNAKPSGSSDTIDRRILKTIEKDPERFLKSDSLKVSLANAKLLRARKKEKLPRSVQELIWVVEEAIEDPCVALPERQHRKLGLSILADSIAGISDREANEINSKLRSTILQAKQRNEDTRFSYETNEFVMIFTVNLYFTKDQQRAQVSSEFETLFKNRKKNDKRHIMVFSWNPHEPDIPYESVLYVGS